MDSLVEVNFSSSSFDASFFSFGKLGNVTVHGILHR